MAQAHIADRYDNPSTVDKIVDAREQLGSAPGQSQSVPEITGDGADEARRRLAREEPMPDENARPDLQVTADVEFRGHSFTFTELGDHELEATKFHDIEEGDIERGTEAAEYVYEVLGEVGVGTDEAYWRRYSMQPVNGEDGIIDLFNRVITQFNEDIDVEDVEAAGNSPSAKEE